MLFLKKNAFFIEVFFETKKINKLKLFTIKFNKNLIINNFKII